MALSRSAIMRAFIGVALVSAGLALLGIRAGFASPEYGYDWSDDNEWLERCEHQAGSRTGVTLCEVRLTELKAPDAAIQVDGGENGAINVHGWGRDSVAVHARIRVRASNRKKAEAIASDIRILTEGAHIRAEGPGHQTGASWSVEFFMTVPRRSDLMAQTQNGPISLEHVDGKIELTTQNGPLELSDVGGSLRARTSNGPLEIRLKGSRWEGEGLDAETTNGPVELSIPRDYNARLTTGTAHGPIDLDIPISVRRADR